MGRSELGREQVDGRLIARDTIVAVGRLKVPICRMVIIVVFVVVVA